MAIGEAHAPARPLSVPAAHLNCAAGKLLLGIPGGAVHTLLVPHDKAGGLSTDQVPCQSPRILVPIYPIYGAEIAGGLRVALHEPRVQGIAAAVCLPRGVGRP